MSKNDTLTESEALMTRAMITHFIREDMICNKIGRTNKSAKYLKYADILRKLMNGRKKSCSFCQHLGVEADFQYCMDCVRFKDRIDNYKKMPIPKPKRIVKQNGYRLEV